MHVLARTPEVCFACEVGGLDHQCFSFPMSARISHPLADVLRKMWTSVRWDNARIMNLFVENHHVSGSLDEPKIIVVAGWRHRRTAVGAHDTALRHGAVFRPLGRALVRLFECGHSLLRLWRQRRDLSVRRIY